MRLISGHWSVVTHHWSCGGCGSGRGDAEGDCDDGDLDLDDRDLEPAAPEHVEPKGKFLL